MSKEIKIPCDTILLPTVFGAGDCNTKVIEKRLKVDILLRDENIKILGDESRADAAALIVREIIKMAKDHKDITTGDINYLISMEEERIDLKQIEDIRGDVIAYTTTGKAIVPKTLGQKAYVDAIKNKMIVFGVGPAGTGKTYLAMASAITAFKNEEVGRIILTRPAIEAGEKLGFLPGDLQSKVDPYLRPLYDALYQIMGADSFNRNMEKGLIEVAPLAYMRGRTLDNAFIILDEAQNTTPAQMKMFLTRIGFGSKAVITGDSTQKDLPYGTKSGLDEAMKVLKDIEDISFCNLTAKDVVRHPLVMEIVGAYEKYEKAQKRQGNVNGKSKKSF